MKKHNFIGKVTLEANVNIIKSTNSKALIIDVPNPLSSYYTRFTDIKKPNSVIFVTKKANSFECILRSTKKINEKYNLELNSAKCEVYVGNTTHYGIRLKGINRYTDIDTIMGYYSTDGYNFNTNNKLRDTEKVTIRINKFFDFNEVNATILQSSKNKDAYFFKLDKRLTWEDFKEKTKYVKHNIKSSDYDIAQGIIYNKGEINDIVRIVKPNLSLDLVKEIENKYNR